MRRDRVAANDPFAAQPTAPANSGNASASKNTPAAGGKRVAAADPFASGGAAAASSGQQQPQQNQQQQQQTTTGNNNFQRPPPPSIAAGSALFDPFFKPSAKAHRGSSFLPSASNNNNARFQRNNTNTAGDSSSLASSRAMSTSTDLGTGAKPLSLGSSPVLTGGGNSNFVSFINDTLEQSEEAHRARQEQERQAAERVKNMTADTIVQEWNSRFFPPSSAADDAAAASSSSLSLPVPSFVYDRKRAAGLAASTSQQQQAATTAANSVAPSSASQSPVPVLGHQQQQQQAASSSSAATSSKQQQQARAVPFMLDNFPEVEWWDRPFVPAPSYRLGAVKQLPKLGGPTATVADDVVGEQQNQQQQSAPVSAADKILTILNPGKKAPSVTRLLHVSSNSSSSSSSALVVTTEPRKIGWNPPPTDALKQRAQDAAQESAMSIKTPEELRKERHARRVAAAKEREDVEKQERAKQHNFGLTKSIGVQQQNDGDDDAAAQQEQATLQEHDKLKMKHLQTNRLFGDLVDDLTTGRKLRTIVAERIQKSLEDDHRRHVEAKQHQVDHEFDVQKRHATTFPRVIAVRVLGITDDRAVQRLKLECKGMFLRGALLWIEKKYLVGVLVGGLKATQKAEALFVRRAVQHKDLLKVGTSSEVVWGGVISEFAFERSFLVENSPFERDGSFKKPVSMQQTAPGNEDFRGKYESVPVVRCDTLESAQAWFQKHGVDWVWDAIVETPVAATTSSFL